MVTNVKSKWVDGDLYFYDKSDNEICHFDGTNRALVLPSGAVFTCASLNLDTTEMGLLDGATAGSITASKVVSRTASQGVPLATLVVALGAGTGQSDGTALTKDINLITGSNSSKAAVLPTAVVGQVIKVVNTVANATLPVFPATGGSINGATVNTAFTIGPAQEATFYCTALLTWYVELGAAKTSTVAQLNYLDIATLGTGAASKAIVLDGSSNYTYPAAGKFTMAGRLASTYVPADHVTSGLSAGVYGTPLVDATLVDNILFSVNFSTATNKTLGDTSCMAAYIGVRNTAATTNNKLQGLLVSNSTGYNCYDSYAVQGHTAIGSGGVSTQNANGHLTGLSGKLALNGAVGQGWVSGVLAIVEGAGAVTGLCHVIAAQVEATCTDSVVDAILFLGADAIATAAIKTTGGEHIPAFLDMNDMGNSGYVTTGGTDCTASGATDPSYTIKVIVPGGAAGYIRVWGAA